MRLQNQQIHLRLSKELLVHVDRIRQILELDRTEFIRQAIVEKLRSHIPDAFPSKEGLNILMTDQQLDELIDIMIRERRRRGIRYWPR